ncbi:MAG: UV damage endonuclease UvsE [Nitrospirota bacterium]|nr:UV damage endonuclease UvsE [Nitrospirota bacterium]
MTSSERIRFRTITRTRLLSLGPEAQSAALLDIYRSNANKLDEALTFCLEEDIKLYRIPSTLFPFADHAIGRPIFAGLRAVLRLIGRRATASGIRLVSHPDQYVVLNSESPSVVENSRTILVHQGRVCDFLGQPRSPWNALTLHGGKGGRSGQLVNAIAKLPLPVRSRLVLENDERAYGAPEILTICKAAKIPMVFDAHHHIVRENLQSYDHSSVGRFLRLARETWPHPAWQLVHISNGRRSFNDMAHSDVIEYLPRSFRKAPWIEVEAKHKEVAIRLLKGAGDRS